VVHGCRGFELLKVGGAVPQTAPPYLVIRRYNSGPLNFAAYSPGTTSATEDPDLSASSDQRCRSRGRADRRFYVRVLTRAATLRDRWSSPVSSYKVVRGNRRPRRGVRVMRAARSYWEGRPSASGWARR
jgi:hypothetical protein